MNAYNIINNVFLSYDCQRHFLHLSLRQVCGQINQWQLIIMISTAIQNIPDKLWTNYFFLSTFILVSICLFLAELRILLQMLRLERQHIFVTMGDLTILLFFLCGKYYINKMKRGNLYY